MLVNLASFGNAGAIAKLRGVAANGIVHPAQIELRASTTLFRLHDGAKPLGPWWFTGFEYQRIARLLQCSPSDLSVGRDQGYSPLASAFVLLPEWYDYRSDQLFRFSCITLRSDFFAFYGEGKNAPKLGGRFRARQVFLPDLQFYQNSFAAIKMQGIVDAQLANDVTLFGSRQQHFE